MDTKWFKDRQKQVGVTAEDIAREMGRARSNVSHILNGHQRMSLDWAKAFAKVLDVSLAEVLKRAGVSTETETRPLQPGFAESDAVPFGEAGAAAQTAAETARTLGGGRPGVDVWTVRGHAMALLGYLPGDCILVDTHQSERCGQGDVVIAQVYNWQTGTAETILRLFEPPVLVAANVDPGTRRTRVVDNANVVIKGKVIASWRRA